MANDYDRILKENIEQLILPIAEKLLGIHVGQLEEIPNDLQITLERKPDFTKKAADQYGEPFILHLEFQVKDEKNMVLRMQTYKAILQEKYPLPVAQFVVYLGRSQPKMKRELTDLIAGEKTNYAFTLVNIQEYPYQSLLTSDVPEEVMLAILSNFRNEDPAKIVEQVLTRLVKASANKKALRRYIRQLTILAGLRNLRGETYQQLQKMAIETDIDITQDAWYIQGMEKGMEKGMKKKTEELITSFLKNTDLSVADIARAAEVSKQYVQKLKRKHIKDKP